MQGSTKAASLRLTSSLFDGGAVLYEPSKWSDGLFPAMAIALSPRYTEAGTTYRCDAPTFDRVRCILEDSSSSMQEMVSGLGEALSILDAKAPSYPECVRQIGRAVAGLSELAATTRDDAGIMAFDVRVSAVEHKPMQFDTEEPTTLALRTDRPQDFANGCYDMKGLMCTLQSKPMADIAKGLDDGFSAIVASGSQSRVLGAISSLAVYLGPVLRGETDLDVRLADPCTEYLMAFKAANDAGQLRAAPTAPTEAGEHRWGESAGALDVRSSVLAMRAAWLTEPTPFEEHPDAFSIVGDDYNCLGQPYLAVTERVVDQFAECMREALADRRYLKDFVGGLLTYLAPTFDGCCITDLNKHDPLEDLLQHGRPAGYEALAHADSADADEAPQLVAA